MKKLLILMLISVSASTQEYKTLVVLVDGIPYDVIEKVNTPNLDAIAAKGGFAAAYVGGEKGEKSESPTISAVGYNSMLTGTWANKHNVWGNAIKAPNYTYPTFFQLAKDMRPELTLGIFSTWEDNRTKLLGEGKTGTKGLKLDVKFDGYEKDTVSFPHDEHREYIKQIDKYVVKKALETFSGSEVPDISWVYLEFTDDMGHMFGDSPAFYDAVAFEDELIGKLFGKLKEREQKYNEDWLLVVTTDHGRTAKDGKGHGGQSDRERKTWIVTNQDRLNSRWYSSRLAIVDIFPSVCQFMDIKIPKDVASKLDGKSFLK